MVYQLWKPLNFIEENNYMFKWTNDVYLNDKKISGILIEIVENKFIIGITMLIMKFQKI